ncbi:MAG: putative metal-dependent hydrolase [Chitinophagaceae bacterium]|nr:MAG: putative metal-dependent hydrolase [Chitinophagaceae bacterium]
MQHLEKLKYPIGEYLYPHDVDKAQLTNWIDSLAYFPAQLAVVASKLTEAQLDVPYRPGGWTVRQVIHHVADSHINAYTRVKLTLTEENPIVRPYNEEVWAELPEAKYGEIEMSIAIIKAIHYRLVITLRALNSQDFDRTYIHPAANKQFTLAYLVGNYAWHGQHHLAHILSTLPHT